MVATITDKLKKQLIDNLIADVNTAGSNYYVGIGRSENWDSSDTVPDPTNTIRDSRNFRLAMQSMKLGEDCSYVVPRHNWSSGTTYSPYDDATVGHPASPFFVITAENQVYICLQQGRNQEGISQSSSIQPTTTSATTPQSLSDGYVWKFMFSLGASNASKFQSSNFTPVEYISPSTDSNSLTSLQKEQRNVQNAAVRGQVLGIAVVDGGSGYADTGTIVTITGLQNKYDSANGIGPATALGTVTVSNGQVTDIQVNDYGRFYDAAQATISGGGGSGAKARCIMAKSVGGIGSDPTQDFGASAVMFNSKLTGAEGNTFQIGNDFRQVALIKNPRLGPDSAKENSPTSYGTIYQHAQLNAAQSSNTLRALKLAGNPASAFSIDKTVVGGTSGAEGILDRVDSNRLYFHQDEVTGFGHFQASENLTENNGSGSGTLDSAGAGFLDSADVNIHTGEIMYIDNRASVTRSTEQTEDIKVVIQF